MNTNEKPRMVLTFRWDGTVNKETCGFKGKACVDQTRFIEAALGTPIDERKFKHEDNEPFFDAHNIENSQTA
ncbi:MAG: DUF2997 domain-containing protein [Candidatus Bathyarchaeia archaeon]